MNNKLLKLGLTIGSLGAVVAPIATVISCGSSSKSFARLDVKTINTGGYSGSMNKLASDDISIAGAWGDSRFYADQNSSQLHVVGVEKERITNDGIQVRGDMKVSDQVALQNLFKDLIKYSNIGTSTDLQIDFDGKQKTVFNVYSHADYKKLSGDADIALIDSDDLNGELKDSKAGGGTNKISLSSRFDANDSEYFSSATLGATNKVQLTSNYTTKKTLKIVFIPSNDASKVTTATNKLKEFLKSIGVETEITVSTDYDSAATALEAKQYDVAFLPAETWFKNAHNTNFILQAARPLQVATVNVSGTTAALPETSLVNEKDAVELFNKYGQLYLKDVTDSALGSANPTNTQQAFETEANKQGTPEAKIKTLANTTSGDGLLAGSYEAWLYTHEGSDLDDVLKDKHQTEDWTIPFEDVKDKVIYGYTSTTSSASYLFPELWFNLHFTK